MRFLILALALNLQFVCAQAEGVALPGRDNFVGVSRLLTNDLLGDGHDRWRSGSYSLSLTFAEAPSEALPSNPGQLMEYRLRAEAITPGQITGTGPDRPYVGVMGIGAFTHYQASRLDVNFGGELVLIGEQTGIADLHKTLHDLLDIPAPLGQSTQLSNKVIPTFQGEISRGYHSGNGNALIRPFAEAQAGVETFARVGADVMFGSGFQDNFFTRDPNTGFLVTNARRSLSASTGFVFGGDVAYVAHSNLLPDALGYSARSIRPRVRAGVVHEGENAGVFYGMTWLGREFETQSESQIVGSVRVSINF
ncbi:MAG: lipid A deacylase LpxR family protein [Rhodobacteraceae bacterium]|nr:lipid A deacylase LpxR family protein [Paracoccaceae bacterium]